MTLNEILREAAQEPPEPRYTEAICYLCSAPLPLGEPHYPYCEDCACEIEGED